MKRAQIGIAESARETVVQAAAAFGALLIVLSLFLPWYSIGLSDTAKGLAEAGVAGQIDAAEELGGDSAEAEAATDLIDESVKFSGWSSLELADALLLFVAIGAVLFVLNRRKAAANAGPREDDNRLLHLGLLSVIVVLVLLFTKNSLLGMLTTSIDFGLDKASELGSAPDEIDVLAISPGIGLWIGLLGSLMILVAGYFHSLVDATGARQPTGNAPTATQPAAGSAPPSGAAAPGPPATPAVPPATPPAGSKQQPPGR